GLTKQNETIGDFAACEDEPASDGAANRRSSGSQCREKANCRESRQRKANEHPERIQVPSTPYKVRSSGCLTARGQDLAQTCCDQCQNQRDRHEATASRRHDQRAAQTPSKQNERQPNKQNEDSPGRRGK